MEKTGSMVTLLSLAHLWIFSYRHNKHTIFSAALNQRFCYLHPKACLWIQCLGRHKQLIRANMEKETVSVNGSNVNPNGQAPNLEVIFGFLKIIFHFKSVRNLCLFASNVSCILSTFLELLSLNSTSILQFVPGTLPYAHKWSPTTNNNTLQLFSSMPLR